MISFYIPLGLFCLLSGVILIMDYGRKRMLRVVGIAGVLMGLTSFFHCCVSDDSNKCEYTLANGYFVRNDVKVTDIPQRIDNSYALEKYFGTAAVMGHDGMPTKIDFSKNTVIPIVLGSTDVETEIKVIGCSFNEGVLSVRYKVLDGQKMSYVITPMVLVVVNKLDYKTKIELVRE